MKRYILPVLILVLAAALPACDSNSIDGEGTATGVVLNVDKLDITVGQTATLTATVMPQTLKMGVVWSVIDEQYASVDGGIVTGKAEGVTYVVATTTDGTKKAACMVSVNPEVGYTISIKDADGQLLSGVYGYPGMKMNLTAESSDGLKHSYRWSMDESEPGSITTDGYLSLTAKPSDDPAYIYYAQSHIKVLSEDGFGCKIPVVSSMLRGLIVDEVFSTATAENPALVQESGTFSISAACQGAFLPQPIPAAAASLELGNTSNFSLSQEDGEYVLTTGPRKGVSSRVYATIAGAKHEIGSVKVDKIYLLKAEAVGVSSSTLSFTWTTGISKESDILRPYTIYLYRDGEGTELEASFSIPSGDECWGGEQPRFVFSGLAPGTQYWFKVVETGAEETMESALVTATTEAFNIVMVSDSPAAVGDIILAEDFGQMCWGADEVSKAAGYDVADGSVAYNADTKQSFTSRDAARFVATTGQYAQRSITAQSVAKKESGFRLAHWAQGQYARIYVGPGYLYISTTSYGTHLLTPPLNSIPEGMTAKLKVTMHAAGKSSGGKAVLAVQHGVSFSEISSGTQTNKNKLNLTSNVQSIEFNGGLTSLEKFEVTIDGVASGDRIAFGPETESASSGTNMMLISDMTIEIVDLQ